MSDGMPMQFAGGRSVDGAPGLLHGVVDASPSVALISERRQLDGNTPSTAHVREVYAAQHGDLRAGEHRREFDRWLTSLQTGARTLTDPELRLAAERACRRVGLTGSIVEELATAFEAEAAFIDEDGPVGDRFTSAHFTASDGTAVGW